MNYFGLNLI